MCIYIYIKYLRNFTNNNFALFLRICPTSTEVRIKERKMVMLYETVCVCKQVSSLSAVKNRAP